MVSARENRRERGARGEDRAEELLRSLGMRIVERNFRCRLGEIDVVAEEKGTVVFVEVKSKSGDVFGVPEEMVTPLKRRRLTLLALAYLQGRGWLERPARFDVVSVRWGCGGSGEVRHYRDAFPATGGW